MACTWNRCYGTREPTSAQRTSRAGRPEKTFLRRCVSVYDNRLCRLTSLLVFQGNRCLHLPHPVSTLLPHPHRPQRRYLRHPRPVPRPNQNLSGSPTPSVETTGISDVPHLQMASRTSCRKMGPPVWTL